MGNLGLYVPERGSIQRERLRPTMNRNPQHFDAAPARFGRRQLASLMIAAGVAMVSGTAAAGELYLRAGIGRDRPAETLFMDRDCSTASPAALYGCGTGSDGAPYRSRGDSGQWFLLNSASVTPWRPRRGLRF